MRLAATSAQGRRLLPVGNVGEPGPTAVAAFQIGIAAAATVRTAAPSFRNYRTLAARIGRTAVASDCKNSFRHLCIPPRRMLMCLRLLLVVAASFAC